MRIALVGDFSPVLDEGFKNSAHHLAHCLEDRHQVDRLNVKDIRSGYFWQEALNCRADIIHIIGQPTEATFAFIWMLRNKHRDGVTVLSGLRAERYVRGSKLSPLRRFLVKLARPDLILVSNPRLQAAFKMPGTRTAFMPNGVDLERFHPVDSRQKQKLRRQFALDIDRPVVLHVGHLARERNLQSLVELPEAGIQVVIAGSTYMGTDGSLISALKEMRFKVFEGYQPEVEKLYMLSDCYVFPTKPGKSLSMPLSVLEAMASNLSVITTRFEALESVFQPDHGLIFFEGNDSILFHVRRSLDDPHPPRTRSMVEPFSWSNITTQLENHYHALLGASR